MEMIQAFRRELAEYAMRYITVEVEDPQPYSFYGSKWDTGDIGTFNVWVRNTGGVDIGNVRLHINGIGDFGLIRFMPWFQGDETSTTWVKHVETSVPGPICAGGSKGIYGELMFKAKNHTQGHLADVVEAHLVDYEVSVGRLLNDEAKNSFAAQGIGNANILDR